MNRFRFACLVALLGALTLPAGALSETLTVSKTADTADGACNADCSLREAITAANADPGATTITLPAGDYNLTAGAGDADFTINAPLSIAGAGTATTTIRDANRRLFVLNVGAMSMSNLTLGPATTTESGALIDDITFLTLTLDHVHLTGGTATGASGGALNKQGGTLAVTDSEFDDNTSGGGGAMHLQSVASTMTRVTFSGNKNTSSSTGGGAIYQSSNSSTTLTNATFSNNSAVGDGGAINLVYTGSAASLTIVNSTLTNDNATISGAELARIDNGAELTVRNSILGPSKSSSVCFINPVGPRSDDGSVDSGDTCNVTRHDVNPGLGVLGDNGGAVQTVPIGATSPAFDTAKPAFCPATDARAFMRPAFAGCDVGAFELQGASTTPPAAVTAAASGITQTVATLNGTVTPNGATVTDCHFSYGTTTAYGTSAPCATSPGNGPSAVAVSTAVASLTAGTTYHVKLLATTANGTADGGDVTFKTAATATASPTPTVTVTPAPTTTVTPIFSVPTPAPTVTPSTGVSAALACSKTPVVLIDVLARGKHVKLTGAARSFLVGKTVSITFRATKKVVAKTTVAADGSFTATAPLPPRKVRSSNSARYQAAVLDNTSSSLKLNRRMYLTRVHAAGKRVSVIGHVTGRFKAGAKVTVTRRVTCGAYKEVGATRLSTHGTFSLRVPAATGASAVLAVYRAATTVLNHGKTFKTFTLSQPAS